MSGFRWTDYAKVEIPPEPWFNSQPAWRGNQFVCTGSSGFFCHWSTYEVEEGLKLESTDDLKLAALTHYGLALVVAKIMKERTT